MMFINRKERKDEPGCAVFFATFAKDFAHFAVARSFFNH